MTRRIHDILLLSAGSIATACCLCGCLKDDKDSFDQSATARLQEVLTDVQSLLLGSENGWSMEYFAGNSEEDYGGHNYALVFDSLGVTALSESDTTADKTLYSMRGDDGPVLAFDSFSSKLHYFAVPSSQHYEARGGDYQFKIMSYSTDEIVMKGLRSGKVATLHPLDESPSEFISKINAVNDAFIASVIRGAAGSQEVSGSFNLNRRQMTLNWLAADSTAVNVTVPYVLTTDGIRLYNPVQVGGVTVDRLAFAPETYELSADGVSLSLSMPADYREYDDYAGDYVFNYWNMTGEANVTLTKGVQGETYIMSGLSNMYTLTLNYDKASGRLSLNSQQLMSLDGGGSVWLCAWDAQGGMLSWSTSAGMETVWNMDEEHPVYAFEANSYEAVVANSFIFWELDSENSSVGWYKVRGLDPYGVYYFPYLNNLTKK